MTINEVKKILVSVRRKKARLIALQEYIQEELALMSGVGAVDYSKLTVQGSPGNGVEERYVKQSDRLGRIQAHFDTLFTEMCEEEDDLRRRMESLSPIEYEVILNRYMRGFSVKRTADVVGYSEANVYKIQEKAVKKMSGDNED